jgi:hypothetical protein
LRRELGVDVEMVRGRYGEFKVLIDDQLLVDGGTTARMRQPPSSKQIVELVRSQLLKQPDSPAG